MIICISSKVSKVKQIIHGRDEHRSGQSCGPGVPSCPALYDRTNFRFLYCPDAGQDRLSQDDRKEQDITGRACCLV